MKLFFKGIILSLFIITELYSQGFGSSASLYARNVALGGTSVISARGVYAIGVNPANLAVPQEHKYEISTILPIPTINFSAGNDFITLDDYQYFFGGVQGNNGEINGRYLDDSEKNKFLNLFEKGSMVNTNLGINLLTFSVYPSKSTGAVGFAIQDWTNAQLSLPKQFFELVLYGNEPGKKYELKDFDMKAWYLRDYSLTYALDLSDYFPDAFRFISAGFTVKYIQGLFYAGVEKMNTSLETLNDYSIDVNGDSRMLVSTSPSFGIRHDFEGEVSKEKNIGFFNDPAGTGFGLDFGFYSELNKVWSIAFSVTDIGSISWTEGLAEYSSDKNFLLNDITEKNVLDTLLKVIKGEGNTTKPFTTSLTTAMRLGAGFRLDKFLKGNFPGELLIELNYSQGFNDLLANTTTERFSLGTEWLPTGWFRLRSGVSVGGYDGFNWGAGLGFSTGILDFDFATAYTNALFNGNSAKRLGFAMSTRWTF